MPNCIANANWFLMEISEDRELMTKKLNTQALPFSGRLQTFGDLLTGQSPTGMVLNWQQMKEVLIRNYCENEKKLHTEARRLVRK